MKMEIDTKIAWGIIALVVIIIVAVYYFYFRTPSGELTPEQAGLGRPVHPGEVPPGAKPPPWAPPPDTVTQGQSQPTPSNR